MLRLYKENSIWIDVLAIMCAVIIAIINLFIRNDSNDRFNLFSGLVFSIFAIIKAFDVFEKWKVRKVKI